MKNLKNNKSCRFDKILNEHIKYTLPLLCEIYVKLFNIVLNTGIVPESWTIGIIQPIFKNKGDPSEAENYRPITLLSCFGKLFTAILNSRLQTFVEINNILNECQAGFRKKYSTVDNMFILSSLIQLLRSKKKSIYCAFIDLKAAFDTIWRNGLWMKLLSYDIKGKIFNVIKNLYGNIKSCIRSNGQISSFFASNIGVRQGENLSPMLFSLFLNDLQDYFLNGRVDGINIEINQINLFIKLFILLYADDTVIICESPNDLQNALDVYYEYCERWKLQVNATKTKILIFSSGARRNCSFYYNGNELEIVNDYKYLGILFSRSGSFLNAKKHIADQANRAMYSLIKKAKHLSLPIDIQIELFNKLVKPILLYGCEIWGFGNLESLERVQLRFLKYILHLKSSTPTAVVYGETGVMPLSIDIHTRIISFWANLVQPHFLKLSSRIYYALYFQAENSLSRNLQKHYPWISCVKDILIKCGLYGIWITHAFSNQKWLSETTKQKLKDLFISDWHSTTENTRSLQNYRLIKNTFGFEHYLKRDLNKNEKLYLKFRSRNHKLPIEVGRWRNIPYEQRKCPHCINYLGDEYHYIMECQYFSQKRKKYIKKVYYERPNVIKYNSLMNTHCRNEFNKLCLFVREILTTNII